jgi:ubiquinone/menaquinone biosynthesis C-methylase UbiE
MSESERVARARLSAAYERTMAAEYSKRWSLENPGNREVQLERDSVLRSLTRHAIPNRPLRVLDLGCGSLSVLPDSILVDTRLGLDLLIGRLIDLRSTDGDTPVVNADGAHLPFPDDAFDVVVLSTMMTSVPDDETRRSVASEVVRVLRTGGAMLWYDMRMPNPRNKATRAIGRRELGRLFAPLEGEIRSLTVVPFVARRLGRFSVRGYATLRRIPLMRSHLAACLLKV